jgi:hypothetical protein
MNTVLAGTMGTTIEDTLRFHAVTNDPTAAMRTRRRQRMDGALETIEYV